MPQKTLFSGFSQLFRDVLRTFKEGVPAGDFFIHKSSICQPENYVSLRMPISNVLEQNIERNF